MTAPPKRRWFRFAFSLRTMFVLVTVFGVWLGWQLKVVRERKAILAEIERVSGLNHTELGFWLEVFEGELPGSAGFEYARISPVRRVLGDVSCVELWLPRTLGPMWIEKTENAFPESELVVYDSIVNGNCLKADGGCPYRDSLYKPAMDRKWNGGNVFKTGLIKKKPAADQPTH